MKNNHLLSEQNGTNKITRMDLNDFFLLGTESIITGALITSLAWCTVYPASLGFRISSNKGCVSDLFRWTPFQSHVHELVPLLLCVSLRSVWTMRGPVLWQCKGEKYLPVWCQSLNTRAKQNRVWEALSSLPTNNSRNEDHRFQHWRSAWEQRGVYTLIVLSAEAVAAPFIALVIWERAWMNSCDGQEWTAALVLLSEVLLMLVWKGPHTHAVHTHRIALTVSCI